MGTPHNGRRVKIDYSQSATPHEKGRLNRGNMNDGTRDIGNTQAPVLLFRGLDPLSGPQAIHQAMLYSSGPGMQGAKGMKRIMLIKDKITMASFGFAFVEFVDIQVSLYFSRLSGSLNNPTFSLHRLFLRLLCPLKSIPLGSVYRIARSQHLLLIPILFNL